MMQIFSSFARCSVMDKRQTGLSGQVVTDRVEVAARG
jgi:hypothetical protein